MAGLNMLAGYQHSPNLEQWYNSYNIRTNYKNQLKKAHQMDKNTSGRGRVLVHPNNKKTLDTLDTDLRVLAVN